MASSLYVLTGPPGSGKTALLNALRDRGVVCVEEPARAVITEQRAIGGRGTSDQDPALFIDLMLARARADHARQTQRPADAGPVLFDRAIPDLLAYARHYGLDPAPIAAATSQCRYNPTVFFAPAWAAIYARDDERTMSFEAARAFGDDIHAAYVQSGYQITRLPCIPVPRRVEVIFAVFQRHTP